MQTDVGLKPSVTEYNGTLQLFYYDASGGNLRHAWTTPTQGWKFEDLDGTRNSISGYDSNSGIDATSIQFTPKGSLTVLYKSNDMLKYAYSDSTGWKFAYLDGSPSALNSEGKRATGTDPTIAAYGNSLQAFYQENGTLRHAWGN